MWAIQIADQGQNATLLMNGERVAGDGITIGRQWTTNPFLAIRFQDEQAAVGAIQAEFTAWEIARFTIQAVKLAPFCPACSGAGVLTDDPQVLRCERCGAIFTAAEPIVFEQAARFVALGLPMLANAGGDGQFHFDLTLATDWKGRPCVGRVHGWADTKTRRVVQFG